MTNRKKELNNKLTKKESNKQSNTKKTTEIVKKNIIKNRNTKSNSINEISKNTKSKNKYKNRVTNKAVKKSPKKSKVKVTVPIEKKEEGIKKQKLSVDKKCNKFKILFIKIKSLIKKMFQHLKGARTKKYIIIVGLVIVILSVVIFFIKENPTGILHIYKEYSIGEKITLGDKYVWYVVEDSDSGNERLKLISEKVIDINNDGKINEKDKVQFDKDGDYELDSKDKNNIAYLLKNLNTTSLKYIKGLSKITLLTSKEYLNIRKKMGYDYTWKKGNWLASKSVGTWWIDTSNNGKVYAVNLNGSYRLESSKKKHYVRPVIILYKTEM